MVAMSQMGVVSQAIAAYGTESQKKKYLPPVLAGDEISAICITEADAGSATTQVRSTARREGGGYVCNGRKVMISRAGVAAAYLVLIRFDDIPGLDGVGAVILEKGMEGLSFSPPHKTAAFRGCPSADVIMENCRIGEEHVLAGAGGFRRMMMAFNGQRCINAAISLGIAQGAYEEALAHTQERELYGRKVSENQGVQWHLADMRTQIEAARLLIYRAAANAAGEFPSIIEASMAKLFANEMALEVTDLASQLHGGYAIHLEQPIQRFWRDARGIILGGGPPQLQRNTIGKQILKGF